MTFKLIIWDVGQLRVSSENFLESSVDNFKSLWVNTYPFWIKSENFLLTYSLRLTSGF